MGRAPRRRASTGKFSPRATSASASLPKRLSPRWAEMTPAREAVHPGRGLGSLEARHAGENAVLRRRRDPAARAAQASARQVRPILLDIASLPSDVAGADGRRLPRLPGKGGRPPRRSRNAVALTPSRSAHVGVELDPGRPCRRRIDARGSPSPRSRSRWTRAARSWSITAGPFDLPNMPPMEDHAMMDLGMSHDTPIQRFAWPIDGWLRGFELELVGRPGQSGAARRDPPHDHGELQPAACCSTPPRSG